VHHLGELPHGHLIASACAAAAVMAIPSRHEGMPNSILEALAADRPVVLTDNHSMDFALPARVATEVNSSDAIAIRKAVMNFVHQPPPSGAARSVVKHLNWDAVGDQLKSIYQRLL
jgi:glycosyltransferase involved in cell wall biosynthesis